MMPTIDRSPETAPKKQSTRADAVRVAKMEETMRPTTAFDDNVFDFNALLHPEFDHPRDVVAHPSLTVSEKRAILASWASDVVHRVHLPTP
jgi:hypothetical protein